MVCSEVIEHTLQPLALLLGCRRMLRPGGELLLTTNSASFVGDVLKLASGRHNVDTLERSHILVDHQWRAHMRLYLLPELRELLALCELTALEALYFDKGTCTLGPRGWPPMSSARPRPASSACAVTCSSARADGSPQPAALHRAAESFRQFGLPVPPGLAAA